MISVSSCLILLSKIKIIEFSIKRIDKYSLLCALGNVDQWFVLLFFSLTLVETSTLFAETRSWWTKLLKKEGVATASNREV